MFLTISTTGTPERPATDLGFLLHKHPDKAQAFSTSYGTAHVLYPEADAERCTAALLLEVDPVALVRRGKGKGRGGAPDAALAQYVNDRPYAASSLLAVALSSGVLQRDARACATPAPSVPAQPLPLRIEVPALPARGGADLVRELFEPLGWTVDASTPVPLDSEFPEWGDSRYVRLVLESETLTLAEALRHLYVLLPVLDDAKHYWVAPDEVDKLLRAGEGWLADHPEQKLITSRYLVPPLVADPAGDGAARAGAARRGGRQRGRGDRQRRRRRRPRPRRSRSRSPCSAGRRSSPRCGASGAARVLDLGCGQGQLVQALLKDARFTEIVGVDVSMRALTIAAAAAEAGPHGGAAGRARHSSSRARSPTPTSGSRATTPPCSARSIEHLDLPRLPALEYAVFGAARPRTVARDDPERRVQRPLGDPPRRTRPARRPPLRVDPRRSSGTGPGTVAERHGYDVEFVPVGTGRPRGGAAHPDGRVHADRAHATNAKTGTTTRTTKEAKAA